MICRADTIGVFQIESRAQMAMLPRLEAEALLRPRDRGRDRPAGADPGRHGASVSAPPRTARSRSTYPSHAVEERARAHARRADLSGAGDAARDRRRGFTPGEADQLRRAMAAWRRNGELEPFEAAADRRHARARLQRGVRGAHLQQIHGFGEYGFPESHAASFALLVYVSAWLKRHEPAAFCCALLNSQPMGFYAPHSSCARARDHGVEVRSVDVNHSDWDCTLERGAARRRGRASRTAARERAGERGGERV